MEKPAVREEPAPKKKPAVRKIASLESESVELNKIAANEGPLIWDLSFHSVNKHIL
jgi:hypothetical protein